MVKFFLDENITVDNVTIADIKMQKLYLERDRVYMIAQASTYMFFLYLLVDFVGLLKGYFNIGQFFILLFMGIMILLIASYPYMKSLMDENKFLDLLESKLKNQKVTLKKRHFRYLK